MIRLAVTISDFGAAAHIGGDVEVQTHIVEVENDRLERLLKQPGPNDYYTVSLSVVKEEATE